MKYKSIIVLLLVLSGLIIAGCSSSRRTTLLIKELPIVAEQIIKTQRVLKNDLAATDTLLLVDAISQALKSNPELRVFQTGIKASKARTLQNSLLPNPELDIEIENFTGSGLLSGFKSTEFTLAIGQLFELGGKRGKRTKIAALESNLAFWQYEMKRLEIVTDVRSNFTKVMVAQDRLNLDRLLLKLTGKFKANIDTLVQAGRLSVAESARAQVELSNRKLDVQRGLRKLINAQRQLSATWGARKIEFTTVKGDLTILEPMPTIDVILQALKQSPLLIEQKIIIKKQKVKTELAEAQTIPNPFISAGYRRFNETEDQAFVAGLSIPIPLFNRNQGGRQEAEHREQQSEQHLVSLLNQLRTEISNRIETIQNISVEIETIQNVILPQARKAYDIIHQNYRLGKYGLIDVLDAQRQLFDAERRYLDALAENNLQVIELEGLLGQSLESL